MVQKHRSLITLTAALAAAALLGGCSLFAPRPTQPSNGSASPSPQPSGSLPPSPAPPSAPPAQPVPPPPPPSRENHLSPATHSLVTQARTQISHGDLDGASATLDRALRIEPNNPLLWIERGRLRLAESDPHQAEGCGRKALALASGDPSARKQAGRVLVDALRAQGKNQEAREVESQPYMN
jgi:tetratricopeptide (TPR) repeat protein